jgi:hypothetical protein
MAAGSTAHKKAAAAPADGPEKRAATAANAGTVHALAIMGAHGGGTPKRQAYARRKIIAKKVIAAAATRGNFSGGCGVFVSRLKAYAAP